MARGLKFQIQEVEGLYYLCSENKCADEMHSYHTADVRLCFCIYKKKVCSDAVILHANNPEFNTNIQHCGTCHDIAVAILSLLLNEEEQFSYWQNNWLLPRGLCWLIVFWMSKPFFPLYKNTRFFPFQYLFSKIQISLIVIILPLLQANSRYRYKELEWLSHIKEHSNSAI